LRLNWANPVPFARRYAGLHMRADGASFLLKFSAAAGLTVRARMAVKRPQRFPP
jgi:hypothetical protein